MIPETVLNFWANCEARGVKSPAVWLMVCTGGQQPRGYVMGWNINKRAASKRIQDAMRANPANRLTLVRAQ